MDVTISIKQNKLSRHIQIGIKNMRDTYKIVTKIQRHLHKNIFAR